MKSVKYKLRQTAWRDTIYLNCILFGSFFPGFSKDQRNLQHFFQFAIAASSVREVEFCTIVIHPRIQSLHMQTERGCSRTKINIQHRVVTSGKSTPSESPKLRTTTNPEISKHKLSVLL